MLPREVAPPPGACLALLELGEVGGGPNQALDRRTGAFAVGLKRAGHKRQRRAKQDRAGKRR